MKYKTLPGNLFITFLVITFTACRQSHPNTTTDTTPPEMTVNIEGANGTTKEVTAQTTDGNIRHNPPVIMVQGKNYGVTIVAADVVVTEVQAVVPEEFAVSNFAHSGTLINEVYGGKRHIRARSDETRPLLNGAFLNFTVTPANNSGSHFFVFSAFNEHASPDGAYGCLINIPVKLEAVLY